MGKMSDMLGQAEAKALMEKQRGGFQYQEEFYEKVFAQYTWNGLIKGVSTKFFEYGLATQDVMCFGRSAKNSTYNGEIVCFHPTSVDYNIYNEPTKVLGQLKDGETIETDEFALCYDRTGRITTSMIIDFYCNQLEEIDKTIQSNLKLQRRPYIIKCNEGLKLSWDILTNKIDEGVEVIKVKSDFDMNNISIMNLNVPFVIDDLQDFKREIRNDCLTALGINNVNVIKKERLVSGEANANNEDIFLSKCSRTRERKEFCKRYKDVFGVELEFFDNFEENRSMLKGGEV